MYFILTNGSSGRVGLSAAAPAKSGLHVVAGHLWVHLAVTETAARQRGRLPEPSLAIGRVSVRKTGSFLPCEEINSPSKCKSVLAESVHPVTVVMEEI